MDNVAVDDCDGVCDGVAVAVNPTGEEAGIEPVDGEAVAVDVATGSGEGSRYCIERARPRNSVNAGADITSVGTQPKKHVAGKRYTACAGARAVKKTVVSSIESAIPVGR